MACRSMAVEAAGRKSTVAREPSDTAFSVNCDINYGKIGELIFV